VQFEPLGIDTTAEIVETEWNVLMNRYDSVTVGALRSSLVSTINDTNMHTTIEIDKTRISASNAINNATKWLTSTGGYVIAVKNEDGTWESLIFADAKDPEDWHYLVKINKNGIGFSYDGGQTYRQAWTIDGNLIADFIHGGTLTLGGLDNGNGWLRILNASGQLTGRWDNTSARFQSPDGSTRVTTIEDGKIRISTPGDGVYDQMRFQRGSEYVEMGAHRVFWRNDDGTISLNETWDNIIAVANYFEDHGGWA
jgi:hypothetical protein